MREMVGDCEQKRSGLVINIASSTGSPQVLNVACRENLRGAWGRGYLNHNNNNINISAHIMHVYLYYAYYFMGCKLHAFINFV